MKKIILSLSVIVAVAAIAITATTAYFSETAVVTNNTITAGTIDVSLGEPEVTFSADVTDLKPGMTKYIEFDVGNVGENDIVLRKKLSDFVFGTGILNEPECIAEGGDWVEEDCVGDWQPVDDLSPVMVYDMEITLPDQSHVVMIPDDWGVTMADIKDLWMPIGTLAPGQVMHVKQSYHMKETATNEYQGDTLNFDISIYAEQPLGPGPDTFDAKGLVLENKFIDSTWYVIIDGKWGFMRWDGSGNYTVRAFGLTPGDVYRMTYYDGSSEDDFTPTGTVAGDGSIVISGTYAGLNTHQNAKYWLRHHWDNSKTLWEGNIVNQQ